MPHRDVVVIGASAGGVEALRELVGGLPAEFGGSVFVVLHIPPHSPSSLPKILDSAGPLPAAHPQDGESIQPGRIYVAPPDHHLLIQEGRVRVKRGPKENRSRPSVDALFRSAAYSFGARTVGVILSGTLDDGTSGLWTIKQLGGVAVVQDPAEALFPDMPRNACEQVEVDHVAPIAEIGPLLGRFAAETVSAKPDIPAEHMKRLQLEVEIATEDDAFQRGVMEWGELTPFTCPECHGVLVRLKEGRLTRFRCHTGHAFTPSALLAEVTASVEAMLWHTMRGLEECTMLLRHIGEHFTNAGEPEKAELFLEKAGEMGDRARIVHDSLPHHEQLSRDLRHRDETDSFSEG